MSAPQALDCTRLGYPCTEAEVAPDVDAEGIRLAREALRRLFDDPGLAALEWLRGQPGMVHAIGDGHVIRFRLAGGRPIWVLGEHRLAPDASDVARTDAGRVALPASPAVASGPRPRADARRVTWRLPFSFFPTLHAEPVGEDRDGDSHVTDRDFRRALVLDPFRWEWTRQGTRNDYREGTELVGMLEATQGFRDGGVVAYRPDAEATESQFRGWDTYDLIHYSGHAERTCEDDGPCYTVIFTGDTRPIDQLDDPADTARETGVMGYTDPVTGALVEQRHVGLSSDWFRSEYSGTLDRTIVFVNGCGSVDPADGFVPDYLAPIVAEGDGTTIVGWDDYVPTMAAQTAALDFYGELIADGVRAGDAIGRLPPGVTAVQNLDGATAHLRAGSGSGGGLNRAKARIREVVALHVPDAARLTDGPQPRAVLQGTPGDGRDDTLSVDLVVDGVEDDEEDEWSLDLLLNDNPIRRNVRLSGSDKVGDRTYRIALRNVSLGRDLQPDRLETLVAVAALPEGSESRSKVEISLADNWFTLDVGGAATGSQTGWIWVSRLSPAGMDPASGICHASIHFVPSAAGTGMAGLTALPRFGLTIGARGGLHAAPYPVGVDETLGMGTRTLRESSPDTFFGSLSAELTNPNAELSAFMSQMPTGPAAPFFSRGGQVVIDYVDAERIEGSFAMTLFALVPIGGLYTDSQGLEVGEATVTGQFAGPFEPVNPLLARVSPPYETIYNCTPPGG